MPNKAIFLDRDGVINPLVYNLATNEYESPHYVEDFSVYPYVIRSLKKLLQMDYKLFLITNQPSYAKGKISLENIQSIHEWMDNLFKEQKIRFTEYYYCYHHPNGTVPEYSFVCDCRKPGSKFLLNAKRDFDVSLTDSWIIGDQDSDMKCGQSQGLKTILVLNKHSENKRGAVSPDFVAKNLEEAVNILENNFKEKEK